MKNNDIVTVENKLAISPQKLSEFSSQLSIVQAERKRIESTYSQIETAKKIGSRLSLNEVLDMAKFCTTVALLQD